MNRCLHNLVILIFAGPPQWAILSTTCFYDLELGFGHFLNPCHVCSSVVFDSDLLHLLGHRVRRLVRPLVKPRHELAKPRLDRRASASA